jgi:putative Mg2+ transporter-C (MgtC) family protein
MQPEDIILRLFLAAVAGGVVGAEREYRNKSAGFRTLILICLGSCLFTIASVLIEEDSKDRIASNIVTGIGFVGAGVIFKSDTGVRGLTTAATVWVTAAIGMAIAGGFYLASGISLLLVLIVLYIMSYLGKILERTNVQFLYRITFGGAVEGGLDYEEFMDMHKMRFQRASLSKKNTELIYQYNIKGPEEKHHLLINKLINDRRVVSFESIDPS